MAAVAAVQRYRQQQRAKYEMHGKVAVQATRPQGLIHTHLGVPQQQCVGLCLYRRCVAVQRVQPVHHCTRQAQGSAAYRSLCEQWVPCVSGVYRLS